jgi:hypothetical protein
LRKIFEFGGQGGGLIAGFGCGGHMAPAPPILETRRLFCEWTSAGQKTRLGPMDNFQRFVL